MAADIEIRRLVMVLHEMNKTMIKQNKIQEALLREMRQHFKQKGIEVPSDLSSDDDEDIP